MHLHAFIFWAESKSKNKFQQIIPSWPQYELFFLRALNLHLLLKCALFVYSAIKLDPVRFKNERTRSLHWIEWFIRK